MEIKVLFFDAYGTVLEDIKHTLVEVADSIVEEYELDIPGSEFLDQWSEKFWKILDKDFHTIKEANEKSLKGMFKKYKIQTDPLEFTDSLHQRWFYAEVYPEVERIMELLEDVPRCLVSNADDDFLLACLESNNLVFDEIITSEGTKSYKPAKRIFKAALKKMSCKASEAVHLGNSLERDVVGAINSGIDAIWVNREMVARDPECPRPAMEIPDLESVPSIFGYRETMEEE